MKLLGVIIAVATASTAISTEEKRFCYCCLDGLQWACCAACILGGGDGDGDDKVAESLTAIQADLNETETEACGKCALCHLNGDYCSECNQGDDGCPADVYLKMETVFSALKNE